MSDPPNPSNPEAPDPEQGDVHDDEPTEAELEEAAALAIALERGTAREALPDDAIETAALVRYSVDGGELASERKAAIWAEVMDKARVPEAEPRALPAWRWLKWLVPSLGLATAAAIAAIVVVSDPGPTAALLPLPEGELIEAQAFAASGSSEGARALEREMRTYRTDVYAALEARYQER